MTKDEALNLALDAFKTLMIERGSIYDKAIIAIREALAQPEPWEKFCDSNCVWTDHHPDCKLAEQHQDWCASLTQMLMSMPPKPAPCNCKPKQEPVTLDVSGLTGSTLIPANWKSCAPIESTPPQLKEPEQERFLVATIGNWGRVEWADGVFPSIGDKMYSAPPKWIGLTFDERLELAQDVDWPASAYCEYAEKIEAKLKEKNT